MGASCVTMPPVLAPRAVWPILVCLRMRLTPSTRTRCTLGYAAITLPVTPRSFPLITRTVSPFFTCIFAMAQSTSGARDDLHDLLVAQLAAHRAEDARPARVAVGLEDDGGVLV